MIVIKLGGAAGIDHTALCHDIARHWRAGQRMVVVHGASDETDRLAERLGVPQRTLTTPSGHVSRYTDRETLEIFAMATARINRTLVEQLQGLGVNAFGLSGLDGRVLQARRKAAQRSVENGRVRIVRDDWTGAIAGVNAGLLQTLLDAGYLPIVAPLAAGEAGEMLNVDGDRAAASIAGALNADLLVLLSNVAGLYRSYPDPDSLVRHIAAESLPEAEGWAQGRMRKKLMGAGEALRDGVGTVIIGDARRDEPLGDALAGWGTTIGGEQLPALRRVEVAR